MTWIATISRHQWISCSNFPGDHIADKDNYFKRTKEEEEEEDLGSGQILHLFTTGTVQLGSQAWRTGIWVPLVSTRIPSGCCCITMAMAAPRNDVKVAIRVRPLLPKEKGYKHRWIYTDTTITPDSSQSSTASYVFDSVMNDVSNQTVYKMLLADIVQQAMIGFNGTLLAYGQSGSGKTYTTDALTVFAISDIFKYIENCPDRQFVLHVSYLEIYKEQIYNLLGDGSTALMIREDKDKKMFFSGMKEVHIKSEDHVKDVLKQGNGKRRFTETKLNERSSRAHCIFRIVIESKQREDPEHSPVYVSCLNLVDLAGSEKPSENTQASLKEGASINMSLLILLRVIRKLSGEQGEFINYRDSKLTRILRNTLEGNGKTAILCTVTPFAVEETHSTLRFAMNAKKIKTAPKQNTMMKDLDLRPPSVGEITALKNRIKELEDHNLTLETDQLQRRREEKKTLIKDLSTLFCISSKARKENQGFEEKRRETVCVSWGLSQSLGSPDRYECLIPGLSVTGTELEVVQDSVKLEQELSCGSEFSVSHSLDSRSPECSNCGLSVDLHQDADVLKDMTVSVKSKARIQCDICHKNFKKIGHLVVHQRVHTGEKPYTCQTCSKTFAQVGNLNVHKRTHEPEKTEVTWTRVLRSHTQ